MSRKKRIVYNFLCLNKNKQNYSEISCFIDYSFFITEYINFCMCVLCVGYAYLIKGVIKTKKHQNQLLYGTK